MQPSEDLEGSSLAGNVSGTILELPTSSSPGRDADLVPLDAGIESTLPNNLTDTSEDPEALLWSVTPPFKELDTPRLSDESSLWSNAPEGELEDDEGDEGDESEEALLRPARALEYARVNGLAYDHLEPFPVSILDSVLKGVEKDLTDDSHLPQFIFPDKRTDERLKVGPDGARLLGWLHKSNASDYIAKAGNLMLPMLHRKNVKSMRLELPLLKSDNEMDCRRFACKDDVEIKLGNIKLPLEIVEDEKNEGLALPLVLLAKNEVISETLLKEKLAISRDAFQSMADAMKDGWTKDDEDELWNSLISYNKSRKMEPVASPLLPPAVPFKPFEPSLSDPEFKVPILSDPESLTKDDLAQIEEHIFAQDVPTPIRLAREAREEGDSSQTVLGDALTDSENIYGQLLQQLEEADPSTPDLSPRVKRDGLKVEETLTPPSQIAAHKTVHFSDFIEELRLDSPVSQVSDIMQSQFFDDAFGEPAAAAMRRAEQETLVAADTTARVPVPVMDFAPPEPPWKSLRNPGDDTHLLAMQKDFIISIAGDKHMKWAVHKMYRTELRWNPFPNDLAKVALEEKSVEDHATWESFVFGEGTNDILDPASLTWKPPGLRILKEDEDDEEEIEPAQFPKSNPKDIVFLAKKRKREIDQQNLEQDKSDDSNIMGKASKKAQKAYKGGEIVPVASMKKVGGIGQAMLEKMGWSSGIGIGASGEGILDPIQATMNQGRSGLTTDGESATSTKPITRTKSASKKRKEGPYGLTSPNTRPLGIKPLLQNFQIDFVQPGCINGSVLLKHNEANKSAAASLKTQLNKPIWNRGTPEEDIYDNPPVLPHNKGEEGWAETYEAKENDLPAEWSAERNTRVPKGQGKVRVQLTQDLTDPEGLAAYLAERKGRFPKQRQQEKIMDEDMGTLMGGFSAGTALDNFMEMRGAKKPKLTDSTYFQAPVDAASPRNGTLPQVQPQKSTITKRDTLPVPSYNLPSDPASIIVSSALFKHRALLKQVESQCPGITMVERDFKAQNTTAWLPGSVARSPIVSSLASEADIIISPSTGIILTTLQKIKQKPLPGQKAKVEIRDRLEQVSLRYEKLIVLVSEGQVETLGLDEPSCQAFAEFLGFVAGLEATVVVHFVGGAEEMLARWLASCIVQYAAAEPLALLEDETHWELFLRRAGMNAYAAQLIISRLKAPEGVNSGSPSKAGLYGLNAFVEMGRDQRIVSFGEACGSKVLERVCAVIDKRWDGL